MCKNTKRITTNQNQVDLGNWANLYNLIPKWVDTRVQIDMGINKFPFFSDMPKHAWDKFVGLNN